jgi:hypothetical protein
MRTLVLTFGILFALFVTIYGAFFAWASPDRALKFHDTFVDRSKWTKNAEWRQEVGTAGYRRMGIAFFIVGLLFFVGLLSRIPSTLR